MSALTGYVIKWDHSFKLPKLLTKLNGITTFVGLFTLVNEFEQIRYQAFVPTKALSHLRAGLEKFTESLAAHGHPQPILGFTDNVASDAATFIQCIPSLGENVVTVELDEHSELPKMVFPDGIDVLVCESEAEIRSACDTILEDLPSEPDALHVGFDMEWEFSTGQSGGSSRTSLIHIALPKVIYLFRTSLLKRLPEALQIVLTSTRVIKIGRNVSSDFAKLARDFPGFKIPAKMHNKLDGVIELGRLAKAKNVVSKATASLASITAAALHCNLSKDSRATEWSAPQLSPEQVHYAALDAWVALEIWHTIKDSKTQGCLLETASPVGQSVSLFVRKQEVARGAISQQPAKYPIVTNEETGETVMINVSTTQTRALITITEVLAPQVQLAWHKTTLHQLQAGRPSFEAVVSLSCLRTCSIEPPATILSDLLPAAQIDTSDSVIMPPSGIGLSAPGDRSDSDSDLDFEHMQEDNEQDSETQSPEYIQPLEGTSMPSHILNDVWHEMDKLTRTLSTEHSLFNAFSTAFCDTMLVPDKADKQNVQAYLEMKGSKWEQVLKYNPDWLWARVRRYIPEKNLLHHLLEELFDAWGPVQCPYHKNMPLFGENSWQKAKAILHDVKRGWISDPPGIPLYTLQGHDKHGLTLYHCIRGTNSVEGGVHNPIRRNFASLNASVELADALIADFRHRHNLDVGTFHKTGSKYQGHYDAWLDHKILQLRGDITWSKIPPGNYALQDTDPLQYAQTEEKFGIANIPSTLRIQNDFSGPEVLTPDVEYDHPGSLLHLSHIYPMQLDLSHLKGKQKDVYTFLAVAQGTRFAVTPVHTSEEFKLFHTAVSVGGKWFVSNAQPNFDAMAQWWSHEANGTTIFYKLREHLSIYYKTWTEHQQSKRILIASEAQRQPNTHRIKSKHHIATVLGVASRQNPGVQNDMSPVILEHAETVGQVADTQSVENVQMTNPQNVPLPQAPYVATFISLDHQGSTSQQQLSWSRPRKAKKCATVANKTVSMFATVAKIYL